MSKLKDSDDFLLQADNLDVDEFDDELNDETFGDPIGDLNDDWEAAQDQYNEKLERCIEEMQKVVGGRIDEVDLRIAASKYNYNCEAALSSLLTDEQIEQLKAANERPSAAAKSTVDSNGLIHKKPNQPLNEDARDDDLIKNTLDRVTSEQFNQMHYHQLMQQMQQQQLRAHQAHQAPPQLSQMPQIPPQLMNATGLQQPFPSDLQSPHFIPFPPHQFLPPHLQQFLQNQNNNGSNLTNSSLSDAFASMNLNNQLNNQLGNLNSQLYAQQLAAGPNGFGNLTGNLTGSQLNNLPADLRNALLAKSNLERQLNQQQLSNSFLNGGNTESTPAKRALTLEEIEQGMMEDKKSSRSDEPKKLTLEDLESSLLSDQQTPRLPHLQAAASRHTNEDSSFGFNINNLNEFPSLDSNQFPKITKTQPTVQAQSSANDSNRSPHQFNQRNNFRPNQNYNQNPNYQQNRNNPNQNFRNNNNYPPALIPNPLNPLEMISNPAAERMNAPSFNKQHPNKNYNNNNNRNYNRNYYHQGPINPRQSDDEYAGLMTPKDISWLRRIQHMQLEFDDPYVQDYYFVQFQAKKIANELKKRDRMNGEMHSAPQLVIPERNRLYCESNADTTRYVPPDFSGSLGKIRVANVNEPRKLLDFNNKLEKLTAKSESVSIEPQGRVELNKFRRLLLDIEHNLTNVLKIDHEDKKMAALPAEAQIPHREERKRLCDELFNGILTTDDNKNVNFHIANIRKGCMLIFKALQVLEEPEQKTTIIADLLKVDNFHHVVMQKDKTLYCLDYGQVLIDSIKTIRDCDFEYLLRIADGLDDASVVAKFQCGQEIIEVLLKQYGCFDVHDKDQKLKWLSFLERVLEDVDDIPHLRKLCNDHIVALTGQ